MTKPYPALCADCKHSEPEEGSAWALRCNHPKVNGNDPWALASAKKARGTDCRGERERRVKAEARIDLGKYAGTYGGYTAEPPKPRTLWQRFQAWRERTGFLMDGRDGGM